MDGRREGGKKTESIPEKKTCSGMLIYSYTIHNLAVFDFYSIIIMKTKYGFKKNYKISIMIE